MIFNSLMDNILCHYPETVTKMSPCQNVFSALHRLKLPAVWGGLFGRRIRETGSNHLTQAPSSRAPYLGLLSSLHLHVEALRSCSAQRVSNKGGSRSRILPAYPFPPSTYNYGAKRSRLQPPASTRYRNRSCSRLFLPCQNSHNSGFNRYPPQCFGRGTSFGYSAPYLAALATRMSRFGIT